MLVCCFRHSVVSNSWRPRGLQHSRLFCSGDIFQAKIPERVSISFSSLPPWAPLKSKARDDCYGGIIPSTLCWEGSLPLRSALSLPAPLPACSGGLSDPRLPCLLTPPLLRLASLRGPFHILSPGPWRHRLASLWIQPSSERLAGPLPGP